MSDPLPYRPTSTAEDCASEIVRRIHPRARARSESTKIMRAIVAAEINRFIEATTTPKATP